MWKTGFDSSSCRVIPSPLCLDQHWDPSSLLPNGYREVKRLQREADYSYSSSAKVKNAWSCIFSHHIRLCIVVFTRRVNFYHNNNSSVSDANKMDHMNTEVLHRTRIFNKVFVF